jgi:CubicO group peptidase (beta-lactamase class C family)
MTPDAIFRIASQSKALTSAVILSLMEEGKLALNDAAGSYIPSFASTTVSRPQRPSDHRRAAGVRSRSGIC